MEIISLLAFVIVAWPSVSCEYFSATHALKKLASDEKLILDKCEKYVNHTTDINRFTRKLKIWQKEHSLIEIDVAQYINNPLNALLLIKRTALDIELMANYLPDDESKEFLDEIENIRPSLNDLLGAVEGILRLQVVYKLRSEDLANGVINGKETRSPLTAHDLFVIGENAASLEHQDYFVQDYLNLALKQVNHGLDVDKEVDLEILLNLLISSYTKTGNYAMAIETLEELISIDQNLQDHVDLKQKLLDNLLNNANKFTQDDPLKDDDIKDGHGYTLEKQRILISRSCRGVMKKALTEQSKLHCRFITSNAFSRLAPFKAEEANLDPYIILFHDVISDDEISFMKAISEPKIERAQVLQNNVFFATNDRIAQLSWQVDNTHEQLLKLSRRVEDMTGLSQKSAEAFQTQNYGIGGYYHIHWDFIQEGDLDVRIGNRIATVLFFLSDVEAGGATIFPFLKVCVPPQKGAAIFWPNLKSSGERDRRTLHMGCPVLLGSKWVMNRWIHEYHNEFRRPCEVEMFVETPVDAYYQGFF